MISARKRRARKGIADSLLWSLTARVAGWRGDRGQVPKKVYERACPGGVALARFHGVSWASLAQLVEQLICNQQVVGSSPTAGSIFSL